MQFTVKIKASVAIDSIIYIPISRDATNFRILLNERKPKSIQEFKYGLASNKGIQLSVKEGDELVMTYDVPINPSHLDLNPKEYLSNSERYTKWESDGLVEKFAKENK